MNDDDQTLTASSEPSHVAEPGKFEGYKGTLYSDRRPEADVDELWKTVQKPPAHQSTARGFLNIAVGVPLAILLFVVVALVVVGIAFGVVGAIGSALGVSSGVVTVVAIILALVVVWHILSLLGLF